MFVISRKGVHAVTNISWFFLKRLHERQNMHFDTYQEESAKTAIYPRGVGLMYVSLGLVGECGEIANKVKKVIRDNDGLLTESKQSEIAAELGDVLWYLSQLATELEVSLDAVAEENLSKLKDRQKRNVLGGSGDKR